MQADDRRVHYGATRRPPPIRLVLDLPGRERRTVETDLPLLEALKVFFRRKEREMVRMESVAEEVGRDE
ncbi:MAG: hypothetical protein C4551_02395 [Bacillota bacterium]|nr:MAG: hypothetical protein C4551_02395 [Bacillota bacterium]